jgi:two-component system, chemotaxis family, chemotaxis protein CheY
MGLRILVVDDSPVMRSFIGRVISMSGLDIKKIFEAGDGVEALDILQGEWIDIVLTDINMPRMNGEQMIRKLAESGITESIPVIVISTDGTSYRKETLAELGVRGYLEKPFHPEQLRGEIERVLEVNLAS